MKKYKIAELRNMVDAINAARGIPKDSDYITLRALRLTQSIYGIAVDEIINAGGGVDRIFGSDTKNNVGAFLADYIRENEIDY